MSDRPSSGGTDERDAFFQMRRRAFAEIVEPTIARMVAGSTSSRSGPTRTCAGLPALACRLGVHDLVVPDDPEKTFTAVAGTPRPGRSGCGRTTRRSA